MATIIIWNLDETTKNNLRLQAARHGISMEEEARQLLSKAVNPAAPGEGLGTRLQRRFGAHGGEKTGNSVLAGPSPTGFHRG